MPFKNLRNLIFIDIETASGHQSYDEMPEALQNLWLLKSERLTQSREENPQEMYQNKAAIYAEFGKVICISIAVLHYDDDKELNLRVKALYDHDEKVLLERFTDLLLNQFETDKIQFCAHNGKEFDYPYLSRRLLINGLALPTCLDISGKKPWEIQHLDTMQLWKFGDWKSYTSLELLAAVFDISSPKNDINGSDVNRVYYEEDDLERIAKYCCQDVVTTAQLLLKMKGNDPVESENIVVVE